MVLVHHSHPMITDTPESSQAVDGALSRKREADTDEREKRSRPREKDRTKDREVEMG